jgi:hypothetical protein
MKSMSNPLTPFVPKPLCRTPTLSHEPVPAPVYEDLPEESHTAVTSQQDALKSIFRRIRNAPAILPRGPSVSPVPKPEPAKTQEYEDNTDFEKALMAKVEEAKIEAESTVSQEALRSMFREMRGEPALPRGPAPLLRSPCFVPEAKTD